MGYKLNGSIKFPDLRFFKCLYSPFFKCKYFISALVELEVPLEKNTPLAITK